MKRRTMRQGPGTNQGTAARAHLGARRARFQMLGATGIQYSLRGCGSSLIPMNLRQSEIDMG